MLWTGMLRREEHDSSCVIRHFTKRDDVSRLQAAALLSEHGLSHLHQYLPSPSSSMPCILLIPTQLKGGCTVWCSPPECRGRGQPASPIYPARANRCPAARVPRRKMSRGRQALCVPCRPASQRCGDCCRSCRGGAR